MQVRSVARFLQNVPHLPRDRLTLIRLPELTIPSIRWKKFFSGDREFHLFSPHDSGCPSTSPIIPISWGS
jgi:hypothetical protein